MYGPHGFPPIFPWRLIDLRIASLLLFLGQGGLITTDHRALILTINDVNLHMVVPFVKCVCSNFDCSCSFCSTFFLAQFGISFPTTGNNVFFPTTGRADSLPFVSTGSQFRWPLGWYFGEGKSRMWLKQHGVTHTIANGNKPFVGFTSLIHDLYKSLDFLVPKINA